VVAAVVAAIEAPVVLQEERARALRVERDLVHALPELGMLVGQEVGTHAVVARAPRPPAVVGAIDAARRDGDDHAPAILGVGQDRVQAETAPARLPARAIGMLVQAAHQLPGLAGVT
jgi:hypothetical protein